MSTKCGFCLQNIDNRGFRNHQRTCERRPRNGPAADDFLTSQLEENFSKVIDDLREEVAMTFEAVRVRHAATAPGLDILATKFDEVLKSTIIQFNAHATMAGQASVNDTGAKLETMATNMLDGLTTRKRSPPLTYPCMTADLTRIFLNRKSIACQALTERNCGPLKPQQRVYGEYPARRAKRASERDSLAKFKAVVVDLPLEEQIRQRQLILTLTPALSLARILTHGRSRDPEFAALLFSQRESVHGEISDWWDCDLAQSHPQVDGSKRHSCPIHAYTGAPFACALHALH